MQTFHDITNITLKNQFEQIQFIDWQTQPRSFKLYPKFFRRYTISDYEELKFIENFGKITFTKKYGNDEVNLRVNPSAGGLYPCEIYIQIRGVKGFLNGIYHYEPLTNSLTLIHELSNDGLEYYLDINQQKFLIFISSVYFRSAWKYEKRAVRYLLLDLGHQIASVLTASKLANKNSNLFFDFNRESLNTIFSFDNTEHMMCVISYEEFKDKKVKELRAKIPFVNPCDYYIKDDYFEKFFSKFYNSSIKIDDFNYDFSNEYEELQNAIEKRRAARAFKNESISYNLVENSLETLFSYSKKLGLKIFLINNNLDDLEKGLYEESNLINCDDFSKKAQMLAFNQKLCCDANFVLIFTTNKGSNCFEKYISSSILAHYFSLILQINSISSSGVGAYYDDETQKFLNTENNILYFMAVGK